MLINELIEGMAWAKRGNKVVRKFRCTSGRRKGRIVAKPAQCFAAPDMKTKMRKGSLIARKAKKSKRVNPASRRVAALNKASR